MRWATPLALVLVVAAALPGGAAGRGVALQLRYVPEPALEAVDGAIALSPDGRALYVLAGVDNRTRLSVLARDPGTGSFSRPPGRSACVQPWYVRSKKCNVSPGLNNSIAVAATGSDVAIAAYASGQLALLRRTGANLRVAACVGQSVGGFGCRPARGLVGARQLAFSPDGRSLYVAARVEDPGVLVLTRDPATGALRQLPGQSGCFQRAGRSVTERPPCAVVPAQWFTPRAIRVTRDGRLVVVLSATAAEGSGIFVFRRDTRTGALTPLTCYVDHGNPPCEDSPAEPGAHELALTPDGRTVVTVATDIGSSVSVLALEPATGTLERRQCLATKPTADCAKAAVPGFPGIAIAPDGRHLFFANSDLVRAYDIAADGTIAPSAGKGACVSQAKRADCTQMPKLPCCGATTAVVSPDGRWLYVSFDHLIALRIGGVA